MSTMDIPQLIKTLSEYDVKKLDMQKIRSGLSRHTDIFVNIAIVLATVFLVHYGYDQANLKTAVIKQSMISLEKKIRAVDAYKKAQDDLNVFFTGLPQGSSDVSEIINKVNEMAVARNVQILSFSPAPRPQAASETYTITGVQLSVSGNSYQNIGLFARDIEESKNNLRIEKWSVSLRAAGNQRFYGDKNAPSEFNVNMEIASIKFIK